MSLELPFGYRPVRKLSNIDKYRYGPHNTIQDALNKTKGTREIGLTVGINTEDGVVEYWFKNGVEDTNLTKKFISSEVETITVDNATVYDSNKPNNEFGYAYYSGNTYVSYQNTSSTIPQFQEEALYRCIINALQGESPETNPEKWKYQGTKVTISKGNTSNTIVVNVDVLKAIENYKDTDSIFVISENSWYKYDENDNNGILPNDGVGNGSWILIYNLNVKLEENVTLNGVGDVGGYNDGDLILSGTTFTQFVKGLCQKQIPPTYNQPISSLSINPTTIQEIGATLNVTLNPLFNQNDGGDYYEVFFKKNTSIINVQSTLNSFSHTNQIVQAGSNQYSVEIFYDNGPIKNDNFGDPYPNGQILSGSTISNNSFSGSYRNWYGVYDNVLPNNGSDIRNLNYTYNDVFTLNTGNQYTVHVIGIPSTKTLISVIDEDALNADLTSNYVLSDTILTIPDGGGNNVSYKVFILELSIPYSSNHRHNITIS